MSNESKQRAAALERNEAPLCPVCRTLSESNVGDQSFYGCSCTGGQPVMQLVEWRRRCEEIEAPRELPVCGTCGAEFNPSAFGVDRDGKPNEGKATCDCHKGRYLTREEWFNDNTPCPKFTGFSIADCLKTDEWERCTAACPRYTMKKADPIR